VYAVFFAAVPLQHKFIWDSNSIICFFGVGFGVEQNYIDSSKRFNYWRRRSTCYRGSLFRVENLHVLLSARVIPRIVSRFVRRCLHGLETGIFALHLTKTTVLEKRYFLCRQYDKKYDIQKIFLQILQDYRARSINMLLFIKISFETVRFMNANKFDDYLSNKRILIFTIELYGQ